MIMKIVSRWDSTKVLYQVEAESMRLLVQAAVASRADLSRANLSRADLYGADLSRADLSRANLSGADLSRADLSGANLSGADLYGYLSFGPIGSRQSYSWARWEEAGYMVHCGCQTFTLAQFSKAVKEKHGNSIHAKEYGAAIALMKIRAAATRKDWEAYKAKKPKCPYGCVPQEEGSCHRCVGLPCRRGT
jgi:hypothetical protein